MWIRIISIWYPACGLFLHGIAKRNSIHMRERSRCTRYKERKTSSPAMRQPLVYILGLLMHVGLNLPGKGPVLDQLHLRNSCQTEPLLALPHCKPWSELLFVSCSPSQSRPEHTASCTSSKKLSSQLSCNRLGSAWGGRRKRGGKTRLLNCFTAAEMRLGKIAGCMEPKPQAWA